MNDSRGKDKLDAFLGEVKRDNWLNWMKKYTTSQNKSEKTDYAINIVLDWNDPPNPIFVEIENDNGESISIGEMVKRDDGLISIRITKEDIQNGE